MLFNSLVFVVFFGVFYPIWRTLPHRPQNRFLLAASMVFYGWWDWRFLVLLLCTSTFDWYCAQRVEDEPPARRKRWMVFSIVSNLTVLGVFKYLGFFTRELDALLVSFGLPGTLPVLDVLLPVGLSFYTFQAIGYTVDVYRGQFKAERNLPDFLLFITFFPHLVAGPIQRPEILLPQLRAERHPTASQMSEGLWLILWGFVKKVVVADNVARIVARGFEPGALAGGVLLASYAFTWQIYCDFSGYSDIARGLAKWLGVELPINFDLPFFASSPRDIWRRWHITLSQWLRDYLYIPLGGNQKRAGFNLITTMVLGGLWHGANWTFLVWGAWHGIALAVQRKIKWNLPKPVAILLTFHFLMFGFVIFRADSLRQVGALLRAVAGGGFVAEDGMWLRLLVLLCAPVFLVELAQYRAGDPLVALRMPRVLQGAAVVAMVVCIAILGASYGQQFIYFQF